MSKYADLLKQSDKEKEDNLAPARAEEQKGSLGLEIAKLRLSVKGKENTLASAKAEYPLPVNEIVEAGDELALEQRRLAQLEALSAELFS